MILGFYNVATILNGLKSSKIFITLGLILLILFNTFVVTHLNLINRPVDSVSDYYDEVKTGNVKIWSEGVYNVNDALHAVRNSGLANNTCKVGITYGTFSEVMNGYNIEEMESAKLNFPPCSSWGALNIPEINGNKNIHLILFIDKSNKENEINQLLNSGQWIVWNTFYNAQYGSTIVGIIRK